jgi:predicted PurR-regulated permease PerM
MNKDSVGRTALLLLVALITGVFLLMIRKFLMVLFLAGIFAAFFHPLHRRFASWFRGRRTPAAVATLLIVVLAVIVPLGGLVGMLTAQAIRISRAVTPWIQDRLAKPDEMTHWLQGLPFYDQIAPYRETIFEKAGQLVGSLSSFLINSLSSATAGTVQFLFLLGLFLYALFFFLLDGEKLLRRMLYYLPLADDAEERMLARFTSVTRATLKGTAVIGVLQGGLAGLGFWVVGLDGALFWGTIMAVLSIIPAVGIGLVWVPAVVILAAGGEWGAAIGLAVWCGAIAGSVDNLLRPRLVGHDTQMPDLLILFSTLGGIALFGLPGFIIGPIVAALFVTVWDIYGQVFSDVLPSVRGWRPRFSGVTRGPDDDEAAGREGDADA